MNNLAVDRLMAALDKAFVFKVIITQFSIDWFSIGVNQNIFGGVF